MNNARESRAVKDKRRVELANRLGGTGQATGKSMSKAGQAAGRTGRQVGGSGDGHRFIGWYYRQVAT